MEVPRDLQRRKGPNKLHTSLKGGHVFPAVGAAGEVFIHLPTLIRGNPVVQPLGSAGQKLRAVHLLLIPPQG
jgi:hypothetical protein